MLKTLESEMKIPRILLVDDESISNFVSENAIRKIGIADNILTKTNAKEALIHLKNECKASNLYPNLILLDLKMPGMDGFHFLEEFETLCQEIRQDIVVIILSSSRNADDIVRLKRLGNYYLMDKPLTPEKLIFIYNRYFRGKEILSA